MPVIDERARHELYVAAQDTLGSTNADTLMSLLPPVGWAEVATKHDLRTLEERMADQFTATKQDVRQLESRMDTNFELVHERFRSLDERLDERFKGIDERFGGLDERFGKYDERLEATEQRILATVHRALVEQTRTLAFALVGAMVSMASVCLAAIVLVR